MVIGGFSSTGTSKYSVFGSPVRSLPPPPRDKSEPKDTVHAYGWLPKSAPMSPHIWRHQRRKESIATRAVHMAMCVYCRAIVPGFPGPAFVRRMTSRLSLIDNQPTLPALQNSSLRCPLCRLLLMALIGAKGHDSELFTLVESKPHSVKVVISDGYCNTR